MKRRLLIGFAACAFVLAPTLSASAMPGANPNALTDTDGSIVLVKGGHGMAGGIAAAVVITMVGVEVVAITTADRAVGIAVGIKPYTRRGRLSRRPLSFPSNAIAPERPRFDALLGSALPNQLRSRG
jgi:hypothetical protein